MTPEDIVSSRLWWLKHAPRGFERILDAEPKFSV